LKQYFINYQLASKNDKTSRKQAFKMIVYVIFVKFYK